MAMKSGVKHGAIAIAIAGGLFVLASYGASHGWLPSNIGKVLAPAHYDLPPLADAKIANVPPAPYPSTKCASVTAPRIRGEHWEWTAQLGLELANGGNCTTEGSLMAKRVVNYDFEVQNDTNKMVADLISCAKEIHDGEASASTPEEKAAITCSSGANLIDIMGDQTAEVAAQANPQLLKLGPDYGLKLIGAVGYSRGEDACMLPPSMKSDPHSIAATPMLALDGTEQKEHGVLVAASPREGDWNICLKWEGDNALPNNPDPHTFDASAINWMEEPDYTTAAADYVAGKCEDRKEVVKGKLTGNSVHVCLNGVATWTPGDVTIAVQRGGLVKVADSLMYRSQMPSVLVGSGHFLALHKDEIKNLLRAAWDGADQINAYDAALRKATAIQTSLYKDDGGDPKFHGGEYWYHYFHPVTQKDKQGLTVSLGGSAVSNYADNIILFGLDGNNYNMLADYNIFKAIDVQQYPQIYRADGPTPAVDAKVVIDRSYIQSIKDDIDAGDTSGGTTAQADTQDYSKPDSGVVVSERPYSITFATGSAQPLPDGEIELRKLLDSVAITGLKVKIDGYTDNTGSAATNTALSQSRASEVKTWLQQHASRNFPDSRFVSVEGHGPADTVASNATAEGKAQNRRVTITLVQ